MKELNSFFAKQKEIKVKGGEPIILPGESAKGVYFIKKGFVRQYILTEIGEEKSYALYKAGEIFPVIWTLKNVPETSSYDALTDTELLFAKRKDFLTYINNNPTALHEVVMVLTSLFEAFSDRINNLALSKAQSRVIARLLSLAKRFGIKQGDNIVIQAPLTHKDIANSIATTRETTSREVENLIHKGIISFKKKQIVIHNLKKLQDELSLSITAKT